MASTITDKPASTRLADPTVMLPPMLPCSSKGKVATPEIPRKHESQFASRFATRAGPAGAGTVAAAIITGGFVRNIDFSESHLHKKPITIARP
jgi:hypothetical protein